MPRNTRKKEKAHACMNSCSVMYKLQDTTCAYELLKPNAFHVRRKNRDGDTTLHYMYESDGVGRLLFVGDVIHRYELLGASVFQGVQKYSRKREWERKRERERERGRDREKTRQAHV